MVHSKTLLVAALVATLNAPSQAGVVVPSLVVPKNAPSDDNNLISMTRDVTQPASSSEEEEEETPIVFSASDPIILQPIRRRHPADDSNSNSNSSKKNRRQDRNEVFNRLHEESLYWEAVNGTIAELRIDMPDETEGLVDMELFDDLIRNIDCPASTDNDASQIKIAFTEASDLQDAQTSWEWLERDPANHFTLMVGAGDCGWNEDRVLFDVTGFSTSTTTTTTTTTTGSGGEEDAIAVLQVRRTSWREALHSFDLNVGRAAVPGAVARGLHKRQGGLLGSVGNAVGGAVSGVGDAVSGVVDGVTDTVGNVVGGVRNGVENVVGGVRNGVDAVVNPELNPSFSIPFGRDFSGRGLTFRRDGVSLAVNCVECRTRGSFDIEASFQVRRFALQQARVDANTRGLEATAIMGLSLRGDLLTGSGSLLERTLPILSFSPAGVSIPGVLTIGPTVSVSLGAEVSQLKGDVSVSFGGTARIPASTSRLDFLRRAGNSASGWRPTFRPAPFTADAAVEAGTRAFVKAGLGLEISAVETGFSADLNAFLPSLSATLRGVTSATCSACDGFGTGVQGSLGLSASMGFSLSRKILGDVEALFELPLFDAGLPEIAGFCRGFGPRGNACLARA